MIDGFKLIDVDFTSITVLNGSKSAFVSENVLNGMKRLYYQDGQRNSSVYRQKAEEFYQNLSFLKPVEYEIEDVLYCDHYQEHPFVFPQEIRKLKSIWLYYRLVYNENGVVTSSRSHKKSSTSSKVDDSYVLNNFDSLFSKLSKNISGVDVYVKELENMRKNILKQEKSHVSKEKALFLEQKKFEEYIHEEKKKLENEKKMFEKEKKEEQKKIEKANKDLTLRFQKLQDLTDELNQKIASLTKNTQK